MRRPVYAANVGTPDEIYTHGHHPVVVSAHSERTATEAAAFVIARIAPGMRILDIGCGPGSITRGLAELVGPTGSVVGIDNSEEALRIATTMSGTPTWLRFEDASVYQLQFADDLFDMAFGHQVLQHLADPVAALTELHRVLRPGGIVAMRDADYGTMTHHPPQPAIRQWLDMYHQVARANGGEPDAGRRLVEWVNAAGFVRAEASSSTWTYATPSARTAWADLWADRITKSRFGDRAVELELADRVGLEDVAAGWREWAIKPDAWFAFIHGEVVAEKPSSA